MPFDSLRTLLIALMSQPTVVASLVLLFGVHAAIWQRIFERAGYPPALASLLLVPPLTILLPLYVALVRWPSQRIARFPVRQRSARSRRTRRVLQNHRLPGPILGRFNSHRPLHLDSNGLPRFRIALPPSTALAEDPLQQALRAVESRYRSA